MELDKDSRNDKLKGDKSFNNKFSQENLSLVFDSPINTENVFILLTILNSSRQQEIDKIFKLFITTISEKKDNKSPELLASWGIYLGMILRYGPNTNLYINKTHFLLLAFNAYKPYISLYISFFLLVAVIMKTDITGLAKNNENMSIIGHLISLCPYNSSEYRSLNELKRSHISDPSFFIIRLGLKKSKQELAIFLDMPNLLEDTLSEDDVMKAIFMHSNKILSQYNSFRPEHFGRAIQCLNLSIAKETIHVSDWIDSEIFNEFIYMCKDLKHANCLQMLRLAITRNVVLCRHHIKRLPEEWVAEILTIYTQPRWKSSNSFSTLTYYTTNLCCEDSTKEDLEKLHKKFSIGDDKELEDFLEKVRTMNKSHFILQVSGYSDFISEDKTEFVNLQDTLLNNIFDISRNFVIPHRQGNKIYLYSYTEFRNLIESKESPYTRIELSETVLNRITRAYEKYRGAGLDTQCLTMGEFMEEFINGRSIEDVCGCSKSYQKKLLRVLKKYGVKEDSFEWINIDDIIVKFSLITMELQAGNLKELCQKLYSMIKERGEKSREELKRTIASMILIYSKGSGGFLISV